MKTTFYCKGIPNYGVNSCIVIVRSYSLLCIVTFGVFSELLFSKSVLDIKTRLVVTVELGTK